jgi:hypothetical protein
VSSDIIKNQTTSQKITSTAAIEKIKVLDQKSNVKTSTKKSSISMKKEEFDGISCFETGESSKIDVKISHMVIEPELIQEKTHLSHSEKKNMNDYDDVLDFSPFDKSGSLHVTETKSQEQISSIHEKPVGESLFSSCLVVDLETFLSSKSLRLKNNCEFEMKNLQTVLRNNWLTDDILDFFTSYKFFSRHEENVNYLHCTQWKVIEKELLHDIRRKKRRRTNEESDLEGVVSYLNWNNSHWGAIFFHVRSKKLYFYEPLGSFEVTEKQIQVFNEHLKSLGLIKTEIILGSVIRFHGQVQNDQWSCGWLSFWLVYHLSFRWENIFISKIHTSPEIVRDLFLQVLKQLSQSSSEVHGCFAIQNKGSFFQV